MTALSTIPVVTAEEAENADAVVCLRLGTPTPFTDNETGTCSHCQHAVVFRPHTPKRPPKICLECFRDTLEGGRA